MNSAVRSALFECLFLCFVCIIFTFIKYVYKISISKARKLREVNKASLKDCLLNKRIKMLKKIVKQVMYNFILQELCYFLALQRRRSKMAAVAVFVLQKFDLFPKRVYVLDTWPGACCT